MLFFFSTNYAITIMKNPQTCKTCSVDIFYCIHNGKTFNKNKIIKTKK